VTQSAVRLIACAGMLAIGVLSGSGAGISLADTGDGADSAPETAAVASKSDDNDSDSTASAASNPDPPSSTVGNGREDVGVQTREEEKKNKDASSPTKKFSGSLMIPIPRIPRQDELPAGALPYPGLFYTTVVIRVPTLAELLTAMQPQPQPAPAPGPAFRTQEEAPPVIDSAGGGGSDPLSVGVAAEPPVLQAPLVIAPLPIPLPAAPPRVAPVAPSAAAGAAPAPALAADVAVAGTPMIRGSLEPAVQPAATSLTPMSGQATRLGYPRYLRSPTTGELAALALPGVAGLLILTLSGGCIGYRQANSARLLRAQPAARFLR
jgi:hypothetical protein